MLSQNEIDALLNGAIEQDQRDSQNGVNLAEGGTRSSEAPSGERSHDVLEGKREVQSYNFLSPDRFSKEQMRAVELIHEDLAERLTTSLPTFLRANVRTRLVHLEQGRFQDFLNGFPVNSLFHMIVLGPLPGQMVFTLSPNVGYMVLEQRLGGKIEGTIQDRPLTEIDQSLLRGLVEHMLGDIKAAWSKVIAIEPSLEDSTTNQHWVQMMVGNERVILLTFETIIQNVTGTMSIFIPFNTLKPIANELNPHIWITGRKEHQRDPQARQRLLNSLQDVLLPINVILGETRLSIGEIIKLQVGDVIQLDQQISEPLVVKVADRRQFWGNVGRSGKHIGAQVVGVITDVVEDELSN